MDKNPDLIRILKAHLASRIVFLAYLNGVGDYKNTLLRIVDRVTPDTVVKSYFILLSKGESAE